MTHGDKQKAKAGKDQASGSKSSSSKVAVESKAGENGKSSGKGSVKSGVQSAAESKAGGGKVSLKKGSSAEKAAAKSGSAKAGAQAAAEAKGSDSSGKAGSKSRGGGAEEAVGFSNPLIGDAFRNALKKYPNAFRKLTD